MSYIPIALWFVCVVVCCGLLWFVNGGFQPYSSTGLLHCHREKHQRRINESFVSAAADTVSVTNE